MPRTSTTEVERRVHDLERLAAAVAERQAKITERLDKVTTDLRYITERIEALSPQERRDLDEALRDAGIGGDDA